MSQKMSELLTLSLSSLETMRDDFEDQYNILLKNSVIRLLRLLKIRRQAIKSYNKHIKCFLKQLDGAMNKEGEDKVVLDMQQQAILIN